MAIKLKKVAPGYYTAMATRAADGAQVEVEVFKADDHNWVWTVNGKGATT